MAVIRQDNLVVYKVVNSFLKSNTFVIESIGFKDICLVDIGDVDPVLAIIGEKNIGNILLTHSHFDHIYGLNKLLNLYPTAKVFTNQLGCEMLLDEKRNLSRYHGMPFKFQFPQNVEVVLNNGESVELGDNLIAKAIFTPGHNPSCITWEIGNLLFTGDSYIPGLKTVTKLPNANRNLALESENILRQMSESHIICPGHNANP